MYNVECWNLVFVLERVGMHPGTGMLPVGTKNVLQRPIECSNKTLNT